MGKKLFDQAIGKDVHVVLEADEQGTFDVKVSYPVTNLHAPVLAFLEKITAKIPFIQKRIPLLVNGLFLQLGAKLEPAKAEPSIDEVIEGDTGPAAHEAAPIEPAAPQA